MTRVEAESEKTGRKAGLLVCVGRSCRGDAEHRTRDLEIPGLVIRTIPE
jgi:hypothetical protein